jgi:hydroxymethylpyrimidine pyrophosphatase-like HAD family hydrolase
MRTKIASDKTIQEVGSLAEILGLKHPYVIYNGYVYDATKVINHHPGGHKVISSILGREVDRFLYGMYSSELVPEIPPHSHSTGALTLLREPVLKIVTPSPFKDFSEATAVKIQFMNEVSKNSKIYVVGLAATRGEF